jgi:hypothetical protein
MIGRSIVFLWTGFMAAIMLAACTRAPASEQSATPVSVGQDDTCIGDPVDDAAENENDLFSISLETICA